MKKEFLGIFVCILLVGVSVLPVTGYFINKISPCPLVSGNRPKYFDLYKLEDYEDTAWGLTSADFNGDGNVDFAVTSSISRHSITIFYNNGNANFYQKTVFSHGTRINDLESSDFDCDGDIDIIFSYSYDDRGVVRIRFNKGNGIFGNETIIIETEKSSDNETRINPHLTKADYDKDGDPDILIGDNSGKVEMFLNNGDAEFTSAGIIHDWGSISWGVTSADFDNDDDIDFIVTAEKEGEIGTYTYLKRNTGLPDCFEPGPGEKIFNYSMGRCLTYIDCDNDGDMDLLGSWGSPIHVFLNEFESYYPFFIYLMPIGSNGHPESLYGGDLTSADFNNDGWDDFVAGGTHGVVRLFINNHEQVSPEAPEIEGPREGKPGIEYNFSFYTADLNKDDVYLYIDWGDGNKEKWIGPFNIGEDVTLNHSYEKDRLFRYSIRAKAKDIHGAETEWTGFAISIPRTKASTVLYWLRFLDMSTILQRILHYII